MQDQRLDAILVLRVKGGNDIFCSLSGSYLPSFFGLTPSTLARLPRSAAKQLHVLRCGLQRQHGRLVTAVVPMLHLILALVLGGTLEELNLPHD